MRVRQWLKQHGVHHRTNPRRRANAKHEAQDRRRREPQVFAHHPQRKLHVLLNRSHRDLRFLSTQYVRMGLMFPPFETLKTTDGPNTPSFLALIPGPACLWRIDALAVKRSDPRNALQLRTQTPYDGLPYAVLLPANGASLGNGQSEEGRQLVVFSEEFRDQVEVESSPDTLRLSPTWCDYAIGVAAHLEK